MKKIWFLILGVLLTLLLIIIILGGFTSSKVSACAPGECEATYGWKDVEKITVTVDHWTCPAGYIDEGVSGCKKKVDDYSWKCPNGYSQTADFPNGPHACKKNSNYSAASYEVTGWHWGYTEKINVPETKLACPAGSESHGNGCRQWVQTGWNCNCGVGQHPDGNGNCVPDICPTGQVGTPPNCHVPTCEELGNCPPPTCPTGQVGTPPNCHVPTCEELGNCPPPKCTVPGLENLDAKDPKCKEADPGCTYDLTDPKNPVQVCWKEWEGYPNFQNGIKECCSKPTGPMVPREDQDPKENQVTKKVGGTLPCETSDGSHNGLNDAGNWYILFGQWTNVWGDYQLSRFRDWYALPSTPFCAAYTDKDPFTGKILSVNADGKAVQVFHPALPEKNGFIWLRGTPDDAVMLYGPCKAGDVYNESDLTSGVLRRLRDGADKEHPVEVKEYTAPNGRPYWNNR
jgi:hypothetical protein